MRLCGGLHAPAWWLHAPVWWLARPLHGGLMPQHGGLHATAWTHAMAMDEASPSPEAMEACMAIKPVGQGGRVQQG